MLPFPYAYRLPHLPVCSTTVDPATARQLTASAGMLQLASDAPYMPGLLLDDGRPQLLDAPVTGKIMPLPVLSLSLQHDTQQV